MSKTFDKSAIVGRLLDQRDVNQVSGLGTYFVKTATFPKTGFIKGKPK